MIGLELLAKLFKVLRSGASPGQIAGGFILGMILGLTPFWNLHNLLVILLIIILDVNISMSIFGFLLFSLFAWFFDPLFHSFGYFLLVDIGSMKDVYTSMYNTPVLGLSNFNNTVVMGSLAASILLLLPMYFLAKIGVVQYRVKIDPMFQKLKIVQMVKGSKLYEWYDKISGAGEL